MRALEEKEQIWIAKYALEQMEPSGGKSAFGNGLFWDIISASGMWLMVVLMLVRALEG